MTFRAKSLYMSMLSIATDMANEEDPNVRQELLTKLQKELMVCYKLVGEADKLGRTIDLIFERRREALEKNNE